MLKWLKHRRVLNGKSHKHSKMIKPHFHRLYSLMTGSTIKSMTPNCVVFVNVLLPICCNIGLGMPYLHMHIGISIRYKITLFLNYFLKCIIVKLVLIF